MRRDAEDDCRNNTMYGLGEVILWGGDQIVGAEARAVVANIAKIPVEEMETEVLANLSLMEDMDEYNILFKFFSTLFMAQHPTFTTC